MGKLMVRMDGERQRYRITAHDDRFVIMTKPFNAKRTYIYTIADLKRGQRGPCNLIFGPPCKLDTEEGAKEALGMLQTDFIGISSRRRVPISEAERAQITAALQPPEGKDMTDIAVRR
jgi:hypothetical protein